VLVLWIWKFLGPCLMMFRGDVPGRRLFS
jgi:hypothetical protein